MGGRVDLWSVRVCKLVLLPGREWQHNGRNLAVVQGGMQGFVKLLVAICLGEGRDAQFKQMHEDHFVCRDELFQPNALVALGCRSAEVLQKLCHIAFIGSQGATLCHHVCVSPALVTLYEESL